MASRATRLLRRAAAGFRRQRPEPPPEPGPLVTVVVPVYQVEDYVAECLESVLAQTHANLEVVVVDDGSTDGSMDVVRRVAGDDPRVVVVTQANAGLGAARNTGVRVAHGEYLRFVDSDDVLPSTSVAVLLASLRASGSDFVVGNLRRLEHGRTWVPGWAKEVHRVDRVGIGLDDLPDVLKDPFAHNKLFRADFFRRVVGGFPEGIRYEDQEPSAKAYVHGRFDVLHDVVYHWRVREDGTSITQQKSNPVDLRERLEVKERVARVINDGASDAVFRQWAAKAIGFDMRPYYEQVPRTGPEFFTQLQDGVFLVARFLDEATWQQIPMIDRLLALATTRTGRDDVVTLLTQRETHGWEVPASVVDGVPLLDQRYLAGTGLELSEGLRRLAPSDVVVRRLLESVRLEDGRLVLEGYAYVRSVDLGRQEQDLAVHLVGAETGERVPLALVRQSSWTADLESKDAWSTVASSGFVATLEPDAWPRRDDGQVWHLVVHVAVGGLVVEAPLDALDHRRAVDRLPFGPLIADDGRWVFVREGDGALGVRWLGVDQVRLVGVDIDGDVVRVLVAAGSRVTLTARAADGTRVRALPDRVDGRRQHFSLTLPADLPAAERRGVVDWSLRASTPEGTSRLFWGGASTDFPLDGDETSTTRLRCSREGTLGVLRASWTAVLDEVGLRSEGADEVLELAGRVSLGAGVGATWGLDLRSRTGATATQPLRPGPDGAFRVAVPLRSPSGRVLVDGSFTVTLSRVEGDVVEARQVEGSAALVATFPVEPSSGRRALTVDRTTGGGVRVKLRRPYAPDERGRLAQRRLWDLLATPAPLDPGTVVFEAFGGARVADSPLALHDELRERHPGWELCWSVAELTTPVPAGAVPLLRGSRTWVEKVRRAGHLVNNANFPHSFRKHPGQRYLQTWHGTPLKKIGRDMPLTHLSLSYRALMQREALAWDALLAQSPWAGEVLAGALGFDGRVLDQGYPRNDALVDGELRRKQVRHELGLDEHRRVVLYAPTWRDDARTAAGGYALVTHLDLARASRELEDVTFLLRGHSNTTTTDRDDDVLDVTAYPDVNGLMLAADGLVTDYSSMMFDFCVTGKPLYFLVPDLDHYGSATRGFYFDLAEAAPGPVCRTEDELLEALAAGAEGAREWAERYAAFVDRFARYDDGRATARVVDAFWGG